MIQITPPLQQAMQLHQQGQLDAAAAIYQQLLRLDARHADAHNLLGAILVAKKQFKLALKHLHKAVKLSPQYASAQYNLGKCYIDMGEPQKALAHLRKATLLDTNMLDGQFVLANCLVQLGQLANAVKYYEKTLALAPQHVEALNNLGNVWQELNEPEKALPLHQQALAIAPDYQLAMLSLAEDYRHLDQQLQAITLLNKANALEPHADIYQNLGINYQQLGNLAAARESYLAAINLAPHSGKAYRGYMEVHKAASDEDLALLKGAEAGLKTASDKAHWSFAMGRCLDTRGDYQQAIAYYDAGNRLHRSSYRYATADDAKLFKIIQQTYQADYVAATQAQGEQGEGIIFVLGMPRSGTTLVEQIISSHSQVTGAGEVSKLDSFAKTYKQGFAKFHQHLPNRAEVDLAHMANEYVAHMRALAAGQPFVTDKLPHNFLYLGLIRKLLPKAKIVHCKRHPAANCLSIYKAYFSAKGGHKYAYNQKELATYHNLYETLMEHWRRALPDQFYEIKYEDLTTNQEHESRQLMAYCGLDWQDACLEFHKTQRKVKTASAYQVRQPMSNKSVALWKNYAQGLKPMLDHLVIPKEYQD